MLFIHIYSKIRNHPIHNFWKDVVEFKDLLELTDETKFLPVKPKPESTKKKEDSLIKDEVDSSLYAATATPSVPMETVEKEPEVAPCEIVADAAGDSDRELFADADCVVDDIPKGKGFKLKLDSDLSDRDLFCLGRTLGTQDYVGQRVLQIATILRNLSFIDENVPTLIKNRSFVRFFLLCASSGWAHLRNLGLDMLGNVAMEFLVKDLPADKLSMCLLKVVTLCLQSEDRSCCISSLEVLNKLSQIEANEDAMLRHLEHNVYEKVIWLFLPTFS